MSDTRVGIVIPAFGEEAIRQSEKAKESAVAQTADGVVVDVVVSSGDSVSDARNCGAAQAIESGAEWLIFLDADDMLSTGYVQEASRLFDQADLIQPATLGIYPGGASDDRPVVIPKPKSLLERNYLVIGSPVRASMFRMAGGFDDLPVLEDWDLWIRVQLLGATVLTCPEAVYRVGVNYGGRNQTGMGGEAKLHHEVYRKIRKKYS